MEGREKRVIQGLAATSVASAGGLAEGCVLGLHSMIGLLDLYGEWRECIKGEASGRERERERDRKRGSCGTEERTFLEMQQNGFCPIEAHKASRAGSDGGRMAAGELKGWSAFLSYS